MTIDRSSKGYKILFVSKDNTKLLYKKFCFYIQKDEKIEKIVRLKVRLFILILSYSRILSRLLRLEPKTIVRKDKNKFIIAFRKQIFILDILEKQILPIWKCRTNFSDVLNFCIYDSPDEQRFIYWGDYGGNKFHENVNIYRINPFDEIKIVYSFLSGSIRHIHNIKYDTESDNFYILTGDNEKNAGIYLATKDFNNVSPIAVGNQLFRSVVAFPTAKGLLYATDSICNTNHICMLVGNKHINICDLNGSCIYGFETKTKYLFSTVVEPGEGNIFNNTLGKGIKSKNVEIISVDKNTNECIKIFSIKKDFWPMKLFQYGTIMFPSYDTLPESEVYCYAMSVKKIDGRNLKLKI